jgi:hypothetical protein
LALDIQALIRGFQTVIVEHTDTDHPHVHIMVNLVHPETGKQANPFRDKQKAQAWARGYERQRGEIFCHDREAKYAELDRARSSHATAIRAAFNDSASGLAPAKAPAPDRKADRFGRSRERKPRNRQQRPEWQARTAAGNDNRTAREAANRIKAETAAKWSALKAAERAAFTQRTAEASRFCADSRAGRDAIFEKFRTALDAVWKPHGDPKTASPDRSLLWQAVREQQETRLKAFEKNERSALGRIRNVFTLAPRASMLRRARLALDAGERRRVFERGQRAIVARIMPKEDRKPARPAPHTPEPKKVQAERLKAQRNAELVQQAREITAQGAAMKARHAFQITGEKAARAMLSAEIGAAWRQHEATFAAKESRPEQGTELKAEPATAKAGDRYGRSRDRKPRQPRGRDTTTGRAINTAAEAGNLPVEKPAGNEQISPALPQTEERVLNSAGPEVRTPRVRKRTR